MYVYIILPTDLQAATNLFSRFFFVTRAVWAPVNVWTTELVKIFKDSKMNKLPHRILFNQTSQYDLHMGAMSEDLFIWGGALIFSELVSSYTELISQSR